MRPIHFYQWATHLSKKGTQRAANHLDLVGRSHLVLTLVSKRWVVHFLHTIDLSPER